MTKQEETEMMAGMELAVAKAIEGHRIAGQSIAVSRGGQVVKIPPEEITPLSHKTELREKRAA